MRCSHNSLQRLTGLCLSWSHTVARVVDGHMCQRIRGLFPTTLFKTASHFVTLAGLELTVQTKLSLKLRDHLPLLPECFD